MPFYHYGIKKNDSLSLLIQHGCGLSKCARTLGFTRFQILNSKKTQIYASIARFCHYFTSSPYSISQLYLNLAHLLPYSSLLLMSLWVLSLHKVYLLTILYWPNDGFTSQLYHLKWEKNYIILHKQRCYPWLISKVLFFEDQEWVPPNQPCFCIVLLETNSTPLSQPFALCKTNWFSWGPKRHHQP